MELTKQKNYQQAFDLASASMKGLDLEERAGKAGALYQKGMDGDEVIVHFFSEPYHIRFPQVEFYSPSKTAVSLVARTILLHYLITSDGSPLSGKWVGYKDISGGLLYASVFGRRVTEPLVKKFGRSAKSFMDVGTTLGGKPGGVGDASLAFQVLPHIPLQYVLWEGDDEFPPNVQLLFDASVDHHLTLEDIVVLGQMATRRLLHSSGKMQDMDDD
ncbi:MAG: hypothetical protein A2162_03660 [Deltaproteobacteria bacterium RBG_13_52_11b]|nr:MAG: hypothetical protein A2162_03660 [Deltaproteobacteria bacterium RBG_13_52_11b]